MQPRFASRARGLPSRSLRARIGATKQAGAIGAFIFGFGTGANDVGAVWRAQRGLYP
jgi:hypothetical protein